LRLNLSISKFTTRLLADSMCKLCNYQIIASITVSSSKNRTSTTLECRLLSIKM
jgi:hypothetical protein